MVIFRERTSDFSLKYRAIQPSEVFGARRKAALRGKGFAWVLDLRSFDKLREVGVSPYLGFILHLSTLLMFELNEAHEGSFDLSQILGPNCLKLLKPICEISDREGLLRTVMVSCVIIY